jgi:hypothetical protein
MPKWEAGIGTPTPPMEPLWKTSSETGKFTQNSESATHMVHGTGLLVRRSSMKTAHAVLRRSSISSSLRGSGRKPL